jgi:SAM-dependent methyltransferase
MARASVAAAGLQDRIELREQSGEDLADERAFDLAWLPAPFIPPRTLARVVERVHHALKPGGWLLFATAKPGTDLRAALMRFRVATWGGEPTSQQDVEQRLTDAGFTQLRVLPGPPRDFKIIVAGRRAPGG